jgi:HK97 family phage major capsid protein
MQEVVELFRNASDEEKTTLREKIENLNREMADIQILDKATEFTAKEAEEVQRFSFAKFVREAASGGLTGLEKEMDQEGKKELRSLGNTAKGVCLSSAMLRAALGQNVTTAADGGNLVQDSPLKYLEALKAKLVLTGLGAEFLTGLTGDLPFVTSSNISAAWGSEFEEMNTIQKAAFTIATMKPKRLSFTTATTKQLLEQSSIDVERMLLNEMIRTHAIALEKAAINGGATSEPDGILQTSGIGSVAMGDGGGALTFAKAVALETAINQENADLGALAYLTNPKVVGAAKTIEKATNTARFIMENGQINGFPVASTTLVPSNLTKVNGATTVENLSALIFGNFNDLKIGQWGGLDIIVDPYSGKYTGEIEMTINAFHDVLVTRPKSFAAIKDITTV